MVSAASPRSYGKLALGSQIHDSRLADGATWTVCGVRTPKPTGHTVTLHAPRFVAIASKAANQRTLIYSMGKYFFRPHGMG